MPFPIAQAPSQSTHHATSCWFTGERINKVNACQRYIDVCFLHCKCLLPKRKPHFGPWRLWNSKNERPFSSGKSENQGISRQWRLEPLTVKFWHIKSPWWRTVFPRSLPVELPSSLFQSHFVNSCHLPLRCTTKPRGRKKVVVTWSICSQPCTICNISMRSFFTSQVWPPKLEEMQAMPPNSSQQHPVVKFREIRRYQSNLNLISCHAGQRQIPWRLSKVSLEALQGLKVHLFAWTRTLRIYEVSIGRLIDFQIHGVLFKQADLKPLFFCGKSPSSVRDWCLAMWIVILLATQSQSNLRP